MFLSSLIQINYENYCIRSKQTTSSHWGWNDGLQKALVEAEGDFDKAVENLRKKGQKVAANRADRDSAEGAVLAKVNADNTAGVVVSVNCETDFVAKNDSYLALANQILDLAMDAKTVEELLAADFGGMTVAEKLTEQTGVIGEKIEIGGFKRIEGPL